MLDDNQDILDNFAHLYGGDPGVEEADDHEQVLLPGLGHHQV